MADNDNDKYTELRHHSELLIAKIYRNGKKSEELLNRNGSRRVLQACRDRCSAYMMELSKLEQSMLKLIADPQGRTVIRESINTLDDYVQELTDNIQIHFDERHDQSVSISECDSLAGDELSTFDHFHTPINDAEMENTMMQQSGKPQRQHGAAPIDIAAGIKPLPGHLRQRTSTNQGPTQVNYSAFLQAEERFENFKPQQTSEPTDGMNDYYGKMRYKSEQEQRYTYQDFNLPSARYQSSRNADTTQPAGYQSSHNTNTKREPAGYQNSDHDGTRQKAPPPVQRQQPPDYQNGNLGWRPIPTPRRHRSPPLPPPPAPPQQPQPPPVPQVDDNAIMLANMCERISVQASLSHAVSLKFNGDLTKYLAFIQDFDERVHRKPLSDSVKFDQLAQVTEGSAKETVELYRGQINGYEDARCALRERFGQPYQIVGACVKRLTSGPRLKGNDVTGIQKLADQIRSDYNIMAELDLLDEANTQTTLKAIFDRLPSMMQGKWVERVNDMEKNNRRPKFQHLMEFMTAQSKRLCHPVFQITNSYPDKRAPDPPPRPSLYRQDVRHDTQPQPRQMTVMTTLSEEPVRQPSSLSDTTFTTTQPRRQELRHGGRPRNADSSRPTNHGGNSQQDDGKPDDLCPFCSRNHKLRECPIFAVKRLTERREFVQNNGRCWICLELHFARNCTTPEARCTTKDCGGRHHKLVCFGLERPDGTGHVLGSINTNGRVSVFLRILPVKIIANGKVVTTLCLLDNGATSSVMNSELADKLGIRGWRTTVPISTILTSQESTEVGITNCTVAPMAGDVRIPLHDVHIVPQLHIADKYKYEADASTWEHLKDVPKHDAHVDLNQVSILIGEDAPAARVVLETRYGNDFANQPYGLLTPLGWVIAGPTRHSGPPKSSVIGSIYIGESNVDTEPVVTKDEELLDELSIVRLETAVRHLGDEEQHGFGMIAPVTQIGKQIIQEATRKELPGDEILPEDDLDKRWIKWSLSRACRRDRSVPRCYNGFEKPDAMADIQIQHLGDAYNNGYGTASYLRVVNTNNEDINGGMKASLLVGKSRTPPIRFVNIPRLELDAGTVTVRVTGFIEREFDLPVSKTVFWTDSAIALQYVKNTKRRFKTYAANRVSEIRDGSDPEQWRHCRTHENPADLSSRGLFGHQLLDNELWFSGAPFLQRSEDTWPSRQFSGNIAENDPEVKTIGSVQTDFLPSIVEFMAKFSDWETLYCFDEEIHPVSVGEVVTTRKRSSATETLVKFIQKNEFQKEIAAVKQDKPVDQTSAIRKLNPVLIDGVLRGGRLDEPSLAVEERHPMILPDYHPVVTMLIQHYHAILAHADPEHVLCKIRETFWITTTVMYDWLKCVRQPDTNERQIQKLCLHEGALPEDCSDANLLKKDRSEGGV